MSIVWSSGMPIREGWVEIRPGVSVPKASLAEPPHINWRHIDGPLMTWCGSMHWMTWPQRIALALRLTTPEAIAEQVWPSVAKAKRLYRLSASKEQ